MTIALLAVAIGKLFIIQAHPNGQPEELERVLNQVDQYEVGGVLWMGGDADCQREWITLCHETSRTPLLMMQDLEWGMRMRFDEGHEFPHPPTLGTWVEAEIEEIGYQIGLECHSLGIHLNLSPVVDIAPSTPSFIGYRCFGDDPLTVARAGTAYWRGLERAGILGCAKHFPGHGGTVEDSHYSLPTIQGPITPHLLPFQALIDADIPCVMVGHLAVDERPSSLSHPVVTDLLRHQLGFQGVIITDALDMYGLEEWRDGAAVMALQAGCDLLLAPPDLDRVYNQVLEALEAGLLAEEALLKSIERANLLNTFP